MNDVTLSPFTQLQRVVNAHLFEDIKEREDLSLDQNILEVGASSYFHEAPAIHGIVSPQEEPPQDAVVCEEISLPFSANFEIVISPLYLHVAKDPRHYLNQILAVLKPGGRLYLSCLGHHSFHEWRTICMTSQTSCGLIDFVNPGILDTWLPADGVRTLREEWMTMTFDSAQHCFRDLKQLRMAKPHLGYTPLSPLLLKQTMKAFDEKTTRRLSFQILHLTYTKPYHIRDE